MCLKDLEEKGQIKQVVGHSKMKIYSTLSMSPRAEKQVLTSR
jgi:small subunit ribosomal protein S25e